MSVGQAADDLRLGTTLFKKVCRRLGLQVIRATMSMTVCVCCMD